MTSVAGRKVNIARCHTMLALISQDTNGLPLRRAINIHAGGSRTCEWSLMHWLYVLNYLIPAEAK